MSRISHLLFIKVQRFGSSIVSASPAQMFWVLGGVPQGTRGHLSHCNKAYIHITAENAERLGNYTLQRDLLMDASIFGSQIIWRQSF